MKTSVLSREATRRKRQNNVKMDDHKAKRAEILFFYDARLCNPNGDPDENRPRKDELTERIFVTEFRLKRTIRDYLKKVPNQRIFMRQELRSEDGLELKYIQDLASDYFENGTISKEKKQLLIRDHIDMKLFGILFVIPKKKRGDDSQQTGKANFKQVGPVQFSIGESLNKVDEIRIGMTRVVPNTGEDAKGGTFGEKFVVRYAFIQFHGFVNNNVAEDVQLEEGEIKLMLTAIWKGTESLSTSSKFGQKSRLIFKVNYKKDGYIGDLDLKCKLEPNHEKLENITQTVLNVTDLLNTFKENNDIIESVEYYYDPQLICKNIENTGNFGAILGEWAKGKSISLIPLSLNAKADSV